MPCLSAVPAVRGCGSVHSGVIRRKLESDDERSERVVDVVFVRQSGNVVPPTLLVVVDDVAPLFGFVNVSEAGVRIRVLNNVCIESGGGLALAGTRESRWPFYVRWVPRVAVVKGRSRVRLDTSALMGLRVILNSFLWRWRLLALHSEFLAVHTVVSRAGSDLRSLLLESFPQLVPSVSGALDPKGGAGVVSYWIAARLLTDFPGFRAAKEVVNEVVRDDAVVGFGPLYIRSACVDFGGNISFRGVRSESKIQFSLCGL